MAKRPSCRLLGEHMFLARNPSVAAAGAAGPAPLGVVLAALFVPALCD